MERLIQTCLLMAMVLLSGINGMSTTTSAPSAGHITSTAVLDPNPAFTESTTAVCVGSSVNFTDASTGSNTITAWSWTFEGGTPATSTAQNPSVTYNVAGTYSVTLEVTSIDGTNSLTVASHITVTDPPVATVDIGTQAVCESGGDASFTVTSSGSPTYQWQYRSGALSFTNLTETSVYSGTTSATLTITGADNTSIAGELYDSDNSDGRTQARYRCVISEGGCVAYSAVYLNVLAPATVSAQPVDVTKCDAGTGVDAVFSVTTNFDNSFGQSYQWQVDDGSGFADITDDAVYSGATTKILNLTAATSASYNGNLYRCNIGNCSPALYSETATLTIDDKPTINVQPVQTEICENGDTQFTIEATGNNLTYQWQSDETGGYADLSTSLTYAGTNTNTLSINAAVTNMNGIRYRCVVTSGSCTQNSTNAKLLVYSRPGLNNANQSTDLLVCEGNATTLSVSPTAGYNSAFHQLQWQADFTRKGVFTDLADDAVYSGTTTKDLTIGAADLSMDNIEYRCVLVNCVGNITSVPELLVVNEPPLVITSPQTQSVCINTEVSFTVSAKGDNLNYQWYYSHDGGANYQRASMTGNTTPTLSPGTTHSGLDGYKFMCIVSASTPCNARADTSAVADLIVKQTVIETQPVQETVCVGENVTFFVNATGDSLTYQWYVSNAPVSNDATYSGVDSSTLVIQSATTDVNGGIYYCLVKGKCSDVQSNNASLVVNYAQKPTINVDFTNKNQPSINVDALHDSIKWYLDGVLISESSGFSIDAPGSYTAVAYVGGCTSEESDPMVIVVTDVAREVQEMVGLYPNPVKDQLIIRLNEVNDDTEFRVFGVSGKLEFRQKARGIENVLRMGSLPDGLYIINIAQDGQNRFYKIIKRN